MDQRETAHFYDETASIRFYEDRYAHGYMEEWPAEKKERIAEVLREFPLPARGAVLDFGCGNGVLTDLLRRVLPEGWQVFGSDVSTVAVRNAAERYPDCTFFVPGDGTNDDRMFDLLFTHHVLEHVYDLDAILGQMAQKLKDDAAMVHILPCGNAGSLEHRLTSMRQGGIEAALEDRFFYEDEGHVRRLTTDRLADRLGALGFRLERASYSNQHDGAIDWITQADEGFVRDIADPARAVDEASARELAELQRMLLSTWKRRELVRQYRQRLGKPDKSWKNRLFLAIKLPEYLRARSIDAAVSRRSRAEWSQRKQERSGSEMFLCFRRTGGRDAQADPGS